MVRYDDLFWLNILLHFQTFRSHAFVKPVMKQIPIKTEQDIERRLQVKTERKSTNRMVQNEIKVTPMIRWQEEKRTLVDKIVTLKTENQQLLLLQKNTQKENDKLLLSNQKLERTFSEKEAEFSVQLNKLQLGISKAKNELEEVKTNSNKIITDLKNTNQILSARVKLIPNGNTGKNVI